MYKENESDSLIPLNLLGCHHGAQMIQLRGVGFIDSLEFVGLPPRGPNDTAQSLPKLSPSDRTG